jgi:hypothetical protein
LAWIAVQVAVRGRQDDDARQGRAAANSPVSEVPRARPKAVLDETVHDFGFLDPSEKCEHAFLIRNQGEAPLQLSRGPTSCKCTVSDLPEQAIPPGTAARVRVASKLAKESGDFSHRAVVFTNDPDNSKLVLRLQGTVRTCVGADPPRIVLSGMSRKESKSVEVTVYSQVWESFDIGEISSTLEGLTWKVGPADAQSLAKLDALSGYRLHVTLPAGLQAGEFWHELSLPITPADESAKARTFRLDIAGTVLSRISIFGPKLDARKIVRLGTIPQGQGVHERLTMKVRDDHRRLVIRRVETEPDFLCVRVAPFDAEREELGLYRIELEVPPDAPASDYFTEPGEIRIVSDHPKLPVLSLSVAFAVAPRTAMSH